jgi:hypothetical protein
VQGVIGADENGRRYPNSSFSSDLHEVRP